MNFLAVNRRRIAPAILICATLALGAISFIRLQANPPHRFYGMPDQMYPVDRPANIALKYAAEAVVKAQLTALRQNDITGAESYESNIVMQGVGSSDQFRQYATAGYPELVYFDRIKFGSAMTDMRMQRVMVSSAITGADRVTVHASFMLIRDGDGVYRILGMRVGRRQGTVPPLPNALY